MRDWLADRKTVIIYLLVFSVSLTLMTLLLEMTQVQESFVVPHLSHVAWLSGRVIQTCGTECFVDDATVATSKFSVKVVEGCDSLYPTAMLWAAILAFPATWRLKLLGLGAGAIILFIVNIFRVVSMFYLGYYVPSFYNVVHLYWWQSLFILVTLAMYLLWVSHVVQSKARLGV